MIDFSKVKKISIPEGNVKKITSGDTLLWKSGYTNLVPTAIDADGSIYNGVGYLDGYRLSSSGELKAQSGSTTTGFIPCDTPGAVIRMKGVEWGNYSASGGKYCYLQFYSSGFSLAGSVNNGGANGNGVIVNGSFSYSTDENGVTTLNFTYSSGKFAYFRITALGNGADMIVTVDEEIT